MEKMANCENSETWRNDIHIYIYIYICYDRGKKQRLYFHLYKPVSWLLTHLGILFVKNIRTNTTVTHSAAPHVPLFFCSYHILTSSVIYYWTDVWQLGIYLLKIYIAAKQLYWRLWDGERPCTHRNISSWSVRHSANDRGSVHNKEWTKRKIVRLP